MSPVSGPHTENDSSGSVSQVRQVVGGGDDVVTMQDRESRGDDVVNENMDVDDTEDDEFVSSEDNADDRRR